MATVKLFSVAKTWPKVLSHGAAASSLGCKNMTQKRFVSKGKKIDLNLI